MPNFEDDSGNCHAPDPNGVACYKSRIGCPTHPRRKMKCNGCAELSALRLENDRQRAENERLRAKIKWLIEDDERLYFVLYRIANPRPFADCPVEMAQNATRGEHLRREAFDGIRRELEGKP